MSIRFDMVVNCGGREVLKFMRPNYIASQRAVETPLQSYLDIGEVSLIGLDPKVIMIFEKIN